MVDFPINTGIRKIGAQVYLLLGLSSLDEWFAEDITILLSNTNILGTIVIDFAFSVPGIMEYTLDGGDNWIALHSGDEISGGQSRFIDVTTGNQVNFRSKLSGELIRCVVSSVP